MARCSLHWVSSGLQTLVWMLTADSVPVSLTQMCDDHVVLRSIAHLQCNYSLNPYVLPNTKILSNNRS
jgi:hypothetical protein